MPTIDAAIRPLPTEEEVHELIVFLAANHDVAVADGLHEKAERFQTMLRTAKALSAKASESEVAPRTRLGYVIAPVHGNEVGELEACPVHGPFETKDEARAAAELMNYSQPDRVFVRPLYAHR
ncbi:hypothetical protein ACFVU2_19120 [Leifsonia sp. NPDC058194]|uniref:hypothetical protein n=1 Tax=Leifsonia sp. NPDC058194 TaxID=3346374 RepID=UPI0036D96C35